MSVAVIPTLRAIVKEPTLLLRPLDLRRVYMAHVWVIYGDGIDLSARDTKDGLVRRRASGIVLDMGAGHGHLANYLDKEKVTAYVALEPNALMHTALRKTARAAGFTEEAGTFLLVGVPAEDVRGLQTALHDWATTFKEQHRALGLSPNMHAGEVRVDTVVSILVLCSVPSPLRVLRALVDRVLAPGGAFLFYEHVRNPREDVAWWQDRVTPVWKWFFDGCVVGLDGVGIIREAGWARAELVEGEEGEEGEGEEREGRVWGEEGWASMEVWGQEGEDEESMFLHRLGRCVKKAVMNGRQG